MSNARTIFWATILTLALPFRAHALTFGPVAETKTIIIEPGTPVQVVEDKTITVKVKAVTDADVPQGKIKKNIGGWVLMTPWDWAVYRKRLKAFAFVEKYAPDLAKQAKDEVAKEDAPALEAPAPVKRDGVVRTMAVVK